MPDQIDTQLKQMIIANWGLVHELEARAKVLTNESMESARVLVDQSGALEAEGLAPAKLRTYGKHTWYIAFSDEGYAGGEYPQGAQGSGAPSEAAAAGQVWQRCGHGTCSGAEAKCAGQARSRAAGATRQGQVKVKLW